MTEPDQYEMPFVTVHPHGPHDPYSYACGFEMGGLEAHLNMCRHMHSVPNVLMIHTINLPQADLLAMKYGYAVHSAEVAGVETHCVLGFSDNTELDS